MRENQLSILTAESGSDYISTSADYTFTPGAHNDAIRCLSIVLLDDDAFEGSQIFLVVLNTADSRVILGSVLTAVVIFDHFGQCENITQLYTIEHNTCTHYYDKPSKYTSESANCCYILDVTVSLPDVATVVEEEGAIELCAVITTMKAIENYFVIELFTSNDTGS